MWSMRNMEMASCSTLSLKCFVCISWDLLDVCSPSQSIAQLHQIGVPEWSQFNHKDPEMWAPRSCLWTVSVSPWYCTSGHSSYSVSQNIHPFEVPPFKEDDPKYFGKYTFLNFRYLKSKWGLHYIGWSECLIWSASILQPKFCWFSLDATGSISHYIASHLINCPSDDLCIVIWISVFIIQVTEKYSTAMC